MSWFSRALSSAKEAVGSVNVRGVGDSARSLAGGVLSSVARVADDKVRRVGKSVHARLTGRQSFEDAVREAFLPTASGRPLTTRPGAFRPFFSTITRVNFVTVAVTYDRPICF